MCGALKRARLVHPGVAEVVFVRKDDAVTAYKKYNNRCLDGESMVWPQRACPGLGSCCCRALGSAAGKLVSSGRFS